MATELLQPGKRDRVAARKRVANFLRIGRQIRSRAATDDPPVFWPELTPDGAAPKNDASTPLWLSGGRVRLRNWPAGAAFKSSVDLTVQAEEASRTKPERVAEIGLRPEHVVQASDFRDLLGVARREGYTRLVTVALAAAETRVMKDVGFVAAAHLDVLKRSNATRRHEPVATSASVQVEHANASHLDEIFNLDSQGFREPWKMDLEGFRDALRATPHARWRVAIADGHVVGYAITGRSATQGFVQRIAVLEEFRRRGVASLLVVDALQWLDRHRIPTTFVNTESANVAARKLYESFGFELQHEVLTVLEMRVPPAEATDLSVIQTVTA